MCIPVFIAALFTIVKIWKKPVSIGRRMDTEDLAYNGILLLLLLLSHFSRVRLCATP